MLLADNYIMQGNVENSVNNFKLIYKYSIY